ncbi:MAG: tRNA preQ1(34) S-adenosylmethionine ribosyltransferase-isomerase QueA [Acidiferrobacterales bacterium]|nr:tRNA preQ1(34) S-adenosylmethionine ribosyltransferase-isomerase QueA [Acidiferrobacterales bacterium]
MRLSDFDYHLPPERIAQHPCSDRSASQLVYRNGLGNLQHSTFTLLEELVSPGDLIVVNDTRVIPARLVVRKTSGGQVEIMLERFLDNHEALVQLRANKRIQLGQVLIGEGFEATVVAREDRFFQLRFNIQAAAVFQNYASIPLPPYIKRQPDQEDLERYQTVYSRQEGAVAAPTAGLHFDHGMVQRLKDKGVGWTSITLHVGAGTFLPVQTEKIEEHKMHSETLEVTAATCESIAHTQSQGGSVIAVGTTVVRALETAALSGELQPYRGETDIFITPGFEFQVIDRLITNFHLPKSTLLMLVSAFAGYDSVMKYYQYAVEHELRFFSYGDAMLLSREERL